MKNSHAGIDVSKDKFDLVVHENGLHQVFQMKPQDFKKCIRLLNEHDVQLVVMEATGGYEFKLFIALVDADVSVAVVNPRQVRDFARACGKLAKTDKVDAAVIARMAAALEPQPTERPDDTLLKIKALAARRRQLVGMLVQEKNRLEHAREKSVRRSITTMIQTLEKQLDRFDDEMREAINDSPSLRESLDIIQSVPGFGESSASQIVADLPEIGTMNRKQIAALVGLAPRNRDSGTLRGKRTTGGGRATVRKALFMPTLAAIRCNPVIRAYYLRLLEQGKPKMVAVTACMRKLLVIINSLVAKNEKWNPHFS